MFAFDQGGRRRQRVTVVPAPRALAPWVEHGALDRRPASERGPWRIVPDACAHVLATFAPSEGTGLGRLLRARVVGARSRFVDADVTGRGATVGVRLRPGALAALTGVPGREMLDRGVHLPELFGPEGRTAEERLAGAGDGRRALALLMGLLHNRARDAPDWRARAVAAALAEPAAGPRAGAVARRFGIAPRTLRQVAADTVGLSPRRWSRIARLFRALEAAGEAEEPSWTWIAARVGFHDPAHLSREFTDLLGEPPTRWVARRGTPGLHADPYKPPPD